MEVEDTKLVISGCYVGKRPCPRCGSPEPHLHPAVQIEGEVEICTDDFHLIRTNRTRQSYIDSVLAKRAATGEQPNDDL